MATITRALSVTAASLAFLVAGGPLPAQNAEIDAVKRVIREETESYYRRDADAWKGTWVNDSTAIRTFLTSSSYSVALGWDKFGTGTVESIRKDPTPQKAHIDRTNYVVRIDGALAWAEYDERTTRPDSAPLLARQQRTLVKRNGKWRILSAGSFVGSTWGTSPPAVASGPAKRYALATTEGLAVHNTVVEAVTFQGKQGVRVTVAPAVASLTDAETFVRITGSEFSSGVIEAEIAGVPAAASGVGARGFVGIAFRLQADRPASSPQTYDAFYLRPTNGRVEDQERRNHATQYISHPDWTWSRLRQETPSKYESYVDIVPDTWTRIRIEVRGTQAKLFVRDQPQPVLVVNDVKSGASAKGAIALWVGPGTVAHFRDIVVTP